MTVSHVKDDMSLESLIGRVADEFLRRFLDHRPIQARRPTVAERVRKWVRRHRRLVAAALAVLALAVVGLTVGTVLIWREKQRAEARFRLAREAVDEMYRDVAEQWLANQPGMQQVQRRFLEKALRYYEEFAREKGTDLSVRSETAHAHLRVGQIRLALGPHAEAEAAYQGAIDHYRVLLQQFPEEAGFRHNLSSAEANLGGVFYAAGRLEEAEKLLRQSIDTFTRQGQLEITDRSARNDISGFQNNLASGRRQRL